MLFLSMKLSFEKNNFYGIDFIASEIDYKKSTFETFFCAEKIFLKMVHLRGFKPLPNGFEDHCSFAKLQV